MDQIPAGIWAKYKIPMETLCVSMGTLVCSFSLKTKRSQRQNFIRNFSLLFLPIT